MSCLVKKVYRRRMRNKIKKCDENEYATMCKEDIQAEYDRQTAHIDSLHLQDRGDVVAKRIAELYDFLETHNAFELRNKYKGPRIEII